MLAPGPAPLHPKTPLCCVDRHLRASSARGCAASSTAEPSSWRWHAAAQRTLGGLFRASLACSTAPGSYMIAPPGFLEPHSAQKRKLACHMLTCIDYYIWSQCWILNFENDWLFLMALNHQNLLSRTYLKYLILMNTLRSVTSPIYGKSVEIVLTWMYICMFVSKKFTLSFVSGYKHPSTAADCHCKIKNKISYFFLISGYENWCTTT